MRRFLPLIAVAVLLSGCSGGPLSDDEREATVGEVFPDGGAVEGRPVSLTFPISRYDFVVSSPRAETQSPAALIGDEVSPEAADGRAFIDVGFSRGTMDGDVWPLSPQETELPRFWLEYDGTRVELDTAENRAWVVAVPEDPEVRLVAEFDGREILVDPYDDRHSRNGDVYDGHLPRLTRHHCPPVGSVRVAGGSEFRGTECRVEVLDPVPWFQPAGLTGWAPEGKEYVLAKVHIDINTFFSQRSGDHVSRDMEYGEPTYTLAGKAPKAMFGSDFKEIPSRPDDMDVYDIRWVLFEVPADTRDATLKFRLTYTGVPEESGSGAATVHYTLKRSIDLDFG